MQSVSPPQAYGSTWSRSGQTGPVVAAGVPAGAIAGLHEPPLPRGMLVPFDPRRLAQHRASAVPAGMVDAPRRTVGSSSRAGCRRDQATIGVGDADVERSAAQRLEPPGTQCVETFQQLAGLRGGHRLPVDVDRVESRSRRAGGCRTRARPGTQ